MKGLSWNEKMSDSRSAYGNMKNKRLQKNKNRGRNQHGTRTAAAAEEGRLQRQARKSEERSEEQYEGRHEGHRYPEKGQAGRQLQPQDRKPGRKNNYSEMNGSSEMERIEQEIHLVPQYKNLHKNTVVVKGVRIGEGMPKICVPVVGTTVDEILTQAVQIMYSPADIIEWRADFFGRVGDRKAAVAALRKLSARLEERPVLFTYRTADEGGQRDISISDYIGLYEAVIRSGYADIIDIQYSFGASVVDRLISLAHQNGVIVLLSYHDFKSTPPEDEIVSRLMEMKEMGADIAKIALMPQNARDVLALLSASERMKHVEDPIPVVAISMSVQGIVSRISGEVFGSAMTFATAGKSSAPGQIDADQVDRIVTTIHRGTDHNVVKRTPERGKNVILIGFMGTGKSTVARKLGQRTGMPVREMDDMIMEQEGMSIKEIFEKRGEDYFRDVETRQAKIVSESDGVIVSCGGGTVMRKENVDFLKKNGTIILLHASPDTIFERVRRSGDKRPLLSRYMGRGFISWLMKKRNDAYYAAADIIIYTDGMNSDQVADEIAKMMKL